MLAKITISVSVFMFLFSSLCAQTKEISIANRANYQLKFGLSSWVSTTPAIQLGLEKRINAKQALHTELAFVNNFGYGPSFWGYKVIGQYRWHRSKTTKRKQKYKENFLGIQIQWKQQFLKEYGTFVYFDSDPVYGVKSEFQVQTNAFHFLLVKGDVLPINKRWAFEYFIGLGVRTLDVSHINTPDGLSVLDEDMQFLVHGYFHHDETAYIIPYATISFKLVYALK